MKFVAHKDQELYEHLEGVAELAKNHAETIGMAHYGELLGLLHDIGKYSTEFQKYILDSLKKNDPEFNPDEDEEFDDPSARQGRIDHSTAGAQFLSCKNGMLKQILSLCLVSHHSGLINCLTTDSQGTWDSYSKRITKNDRKTHYKECVRNIDVHLLERIQGIMEKDSFSRAFEEKHRNIGSTCISKEGNLLPTVAQFQLGLLVRFLLSTLIDADRQDTADSENPGLGKFRQQGGYRQWSELVERLENKYEIFKPQNRVDEIREKVSAQCLYASEREKGLFTLTVPTGGGKTLASLRFALHHAKRHEKRTDRIIYIVPFTSIIDQNAQVVREILESKDHPEDAGKIVLEHHSNIGADVQSWKEKLLTENWDAPVVYTTMVQFLEALFGAGTRGVRRMHQLANAIVIFDEIQTLPVKCVHMFNNAINFLVNHCGSTVVLCTATQPLLGAVDEKKGVLNLTQNNEIIQDVNETFEALKRVNVHDRRKSIGWSYSDIAVFAVEQVKENGSCLVVVNTKKSARIIFQEAKKHGIEIFYLSTGMCPVHRKKVLQTIRQKLDNSAPILCITTQLIEAGVDISFRTVIRMLAGLDSIAQAAGRCNRHGGPEIGNVYIVNPAEENLEYLKDIAIGKEGTNRVLDDYNSAPSKYDSDIIGPKMLAWYYQNYFYARKDIMDYPVNAGRRDTLLNLLSSNGIAVTDFQRINKENPKIYLRQSFMTAAKLFRSIDAPTSSVIVRYGNEGKDLVNQLCAAFDIKKQYGLFKKAQQYSVNLFPNEFEKLEVQGALFRIQNNTEIFYLDDRFYSEQFGISMEPVNEEEFLNV